MLRGASVLVDVRLLNVPGGKGFSDATALAS
jgi:hypothetical protein